MQPCMHNGNIVPSLSKEDYNVLLESFPLLNGILTVTLLFPVNYLQSQTSSRHILVKVKIDDSLV